MITDRQIIGSMATWIYVTKYAPNELGRESAAQQASELWNEVGAARLSTHGALENPPVVP